MKQYKKITTGHRTTFKWIVDTLEPRYELMYVMGDSFYTLEEEDEDSLFHGVKVVQV